MMAADAVYQVEQIGVFTPKKVGGRETGPRRSRLHHRPDQAGGRHQGRRHHHRRAQGHGRRPCPASSRRSRWCSAACSRWTRRSSRICATHLPSCISTMPASPMRPKSQRGVGLWFPLRLPGPAASGNRARAAGAGIQSGPDHHRAIGDLSHLLTDGTMKELHNPADMPEVTYHRSYRRALDQGDHSGAGRISGFGAEAVRGPARSPGRTDLCRQSRHGDLHAAAQRSRVRLL